MAVIIGKIRNIVYIFIRDLNLKTRKNAFLRRQETECESVWRKLHNKKPHNLHSSVNVIRVNKSMRMRWVGCVACKAEMRCVFQIGLVYWSHMPFRPISCTLYIPYLIQIFTPFEMFYFRPRLCGAPYYTLLGWFWFCHQHPCEIVSVFPETHPKWCAVINDVGSRHAH